MTLNEIEAAINTMKANGTNRTARGRFILLVEKRAKMLSDIRRESEQQQLQDDLADDNEYVNTDDSDGARADAEESELNRRMMRRPGEGQKPTGKRPPPPPAPPAPPGNANAELVAACKEALKIRNLSYQVDANSKLDGMERRKIGREIESIHDRIRKAIACAGAS